jgi:hypothetical protein
MSYEPAGVVAKQLNLKSSSPLFAGFRTTVERQIVESILLALNSEINFHSSIWACHKPDSQQQMNLVLRAQAFRRSCRKLEKHSIESPSPPFQQRQRRASINLAATHRNRRFREDDASWFPTKIVATINWPRGYRFK